MDSELQDLVHKLAESQREPLSILRLQDGDNDDEEDTPNGGSGGARSSDVSDNALGGGELNPTTLESELTNYKELFSKLRFSYMEQVTKEKFLAAITEDPPQLVEREEIAEIEGDVAEAKKELQRVKAEVKAVFEEIEAVGKRVCTEYERLAPLTTRLQQLPSSITSLESEVQSLMHLDSSNPDYHQHLPLGETLSQLAAAETELTRIQREIDVANRSIPSKQRRLDALDRELKPLEADKQGVVAFAEEAVKKREEERQRGLADRENAGRWYRAAESTLSTFVGEKEKKKENEKGEDGGDAMAVDGGGPNGN